MIQISHNRVPKDNIAALIGPGNIFAPDRQHAITSVIQR